MIKDWFVIGYAYVWEQYYIVWQYINRPSILSSITVETPSLVQKHPMVLNGLRDFQLSLLSSASWLEVTFCGNNIHRSYWTSCWRSRTSMEGDVRQSRLPHHSLLRTWIHFFITVNHFFHPLACYSSLWQLLSLFVSVIETKHHLHDVRKPTIFCVIA